MSDAEVPVLIVGGGPVGLAASLLLSRHRVSSLLVERHPGTSVHPKARGLNARTMELFRAWGLEAAVRGAADKLNVAVDVVWAPTLVAPEVRRAPYGGAGERLQADSPTTSAGCAQDALEPILAAAARSYDVGELRFGHELTHLVQGTTGVEATLVERASGHETTVRAGWVIAADGAQSTVRSLLGIPMVGPGALAHRMGIYFRADLSEVGATRPALLYFVGTPETGGVIAAVNLADLWIYMAPFHPQRGQIVADFTEQRCVELVRAATGVADLEVEVLSALPWAMAAATAKNFRSGRVFLAGDSAHLIPPAGGQALNVGIQDVHNLAWKLAGHLHGWAGTGLLDTYEAERRPFALAVTDDAARNVAAGGSGQRPEQFSNRGRVLGVSYESSAVIPDGTLAPEVGNAVTDFAPTARPGSRAPHLWLGQGDHQLSALDLFDTSFVLLSGPSAEPWQKAAHEVAQRVGVPIDRYLIGPDGQLFDKTGQWENLYGIGPDGAVLVRPDGHVAWRAPQAEPDPVARLESVVRQILALE